MKWFHSILVSQETESALGLLLLTMNEAHVWQPKRAYQLGGVVFGDVGLAVPLIKNHQPGKLSA